MGINGVIQWLFKKGMAVYRLDERFISIDKRFEQIDRRFEQIDRRLDQMDQQFVKIEGRLDRIESKFDAAIEMRERVAVLEALIGRRPA